MFKSITIFVYDRYGNTFEYKKGFCYTEFIFKKGGNEMKRLKKIMAGIIMVTLLIITIVPSTSMEVQAASVGRVTGVKAVYTRGKTIIK